MSMPKKNSTIKYYSVTMIDENVVCNQYLFVGKNAIKKAENKFKKIMKSISEDITTDDIEFALDEGSYSYNGQTICIGEPEIIKAN